MHVANLAANLFSYTITGLTAGQSYYVNVRAQNALGLGAPLEMDRPHLARSPFTKPGKKFFYGIVAYKTVLWP